MDNSHGQQRVSLLRSQSTIELKASPTGTYSIHYCRGTFGAKVADSTSMKPVLRLHTSLKSAGLLLP